MRLASARPARVHGWRFQTSLSVERIDDGTSGDIQLVVGVGMERSRHRLGFNVVEGLQERPQLLDRCGEIGRVGVRCPLLTAVGKEVPDSIPFAVVCSGAIVIEHSHSDDGRTTARWRWRPPGPNPTAAFDAR